jgi:hypothetical protein
MAVIPKQRAAAFARCSISGGALWPTLQSWSGNTIERENLAVSCLSFATLADHSDFYGRAEFSYASDDRCFWISSGD